MRKPVVWLLAESKNGLLCLVRNRPAFLPVGLSFSFTYAPGLLSKFTRPDAYWEETFPVSFSGEYFDHHRSGQPLDLRMEARIDATKGDETQSR
jgi:hypothetical protein